MRLSRLTIFVTSAVACGGHLEPYGGLDDGSTPSCVVAGVRLCGGACGVVDSCDGGCTMLAKSDETTAPYGICFADLPDKGQMPCAVCGTGEGCVQRVPGVFVCVPLEICANLVALGATGTCWYADKSPYDGTSITIPTACPKTSLTPTDHPMCGGACGSCDVTHSYPLDRCLGQGPNHPVGICAWIASEVDSHDPATYPRCDATTPACGSGNACAIFPSPPAEKSVAMQNGFCLELSTCLALEEALPGGLTCL